MGKPTQPQVSVTDTADIKVLSAVAYDQDYENRCGQHTLHIVFLNLLGSGASQRE
jgi:hypothetical protein